MWRGGEKRWTEVCVGEEMMGKGLNRNVWWVCGPYKTAMEGSGGICASLGEGSLLGGYTRTIDIEGAGIVRSGGIVATSGEGSLCNR